MNTAPGPFFAMSGKKSFYYTKMDFLMICGFGGVGIHKISYDHRKIIFKEWAP